MKNIINSTMKKTLMLSSLFFLTIFTQAQTIVKVLVIQPPELKIIADDLYTETQQKIILGDSVTIEGGVQPYSYAWYNDGNKIGSSLILEVPKTTPLNNISLTVKDVNNCSCNENALGTSINEIDNSASKINIYPNPATNFIVINNPSVDEKLDITIIDSKGATLIKKQITGKYTLNFNLQSGLYLIKIENKNKQIVALKKFMVS